MEVKLLIKKEIVDNLDWWAQNCYLNKYSKIYGVTVMNDVKKRARNNITVKELLEWINKLVIKSPNTTPRARKTIQTYLKTQDKNKLTATILNKLNNGDNKT